MRAALLLVVLLAVAPARADDDVLLDVLTEWSQQSLDELALEGAPPPSRTVFATQDHQHYHAKAVFGSLQSEVGHRSRPTRVEVVVGDDLLDSSRFKSRDRMMQVVARPTLVVDDVELALQRDLWITADASYKSSVKQLQIKTASMGALGGEPPPADWSDAPLAESVDLSPIEPLDRERLQEIAVNASGRLRGIEGLRHGEVQVRASSGRYYLVTSEGARLVQPDSWVVVYAWADQMRDDGISLYDRRQWVAASVADLPPLEEIAAEVEAMGRGIVERAAAAPVDYYEGPVVFEGAAAAEFFRYLVPGELEGTPPAPEANRTYQQMTRSGPRIGRRLLPVGWQIVDDPTRALPGLAGGYAFDREGVAAEPVTLVEDGYVRDLLMSRIPRADLTRSNGHARGSIQGSWSARLSIWEVTPARNLSARAFDKQVDKLLKRANLERILVVRRLQRGAGGKLPRPTEAVWRYADGREEPVLSISFNDVDRRGLRDILAAGGGQQVLPYLAPWTPDGTSRGDSGLPSVLIAPQSLLVEDMELMFPGPDAKPHALPAPPLAE